MYTTEEIRAVRTRVKLRDHERLRETLIVIGEEGWEGDTARALLEFVREDLVRPLVIGLGMRGRVASQAESTGWAAAWRALACPSTLDAPTPWGVVWTAVDRAVRGEMLATRYATSVRKAWDIHREIGELGMFEVLSYEQLELEYEPELEVDGDVPVIAPIREALLGVGWGAEMLDGLLADILTDAEIHPAGKRHVAGWRPLARRWGLEPWRARRLVVALMGDGTWPGLIGSVYEHGLGALETPTAHAALISTVNRNRPSPASAARQSGSVAAHERLDCRRPAA